MLKSRQTKALLLKPYKEMSPINDRCNSLIRYSLLAELKFLHCLVYILQMLAYSPCSLKFFSYQVYSVLSFLFGHHRQTILGPLIKFIMSRHNWKHSFSSSWHTWLAFTWTHYFPLRNSSLLATQRASPVLMGWPIPDPIQESPRSSSRPKWTLCLMNK